MAAATQSINIKIGAGLTSGFNSAFSKADKSFDSLKSKTVAFSKFVAGAGAAAVASFTAVMYKGIQAANIQEDAEIRLAQALGHRSQALLDDAAALQKHTKFGDEAIIGAQSLIASFVKDEEQIKSATKATLDLAAAKGMDLKGAADLVSKTLGSSTNALSRYGIQVEGAVGSTQRLESLTKGIAEVFGGQAAAQATIFTGRITQMKNAFGDVMEEIGFLITKSDVFNKAIKVTTNTFALWGNEIKNNRAYLIDLVNDGFVFFIKGIGWVNESIRFFHNAWLGLKLAGTSVLMSLVDMLHVFNRTLEVVIGPVADLAVQFGLMDTNPFRAASKGTLKLKEDMRVLGGSILDDIEKTNAGYDRSTAAVKNFAKQLEKVAKEQKPGTKQPLTSNIKTDTETALSIYKQFYDKTGTITEEFFWEYSEQIAAQGELWKQKGMDEVAVQEWVTGEVVKMYEKMTGTIKEETEEQRGIFNGMADAMAGLSAVGSGSLSQIASLFGPGGQMVGAAIEFISNIKELPKLFKDSIRALVQGAKHFGSAIAEIITDIVKNLPSIISDITRSLIDSLDEIVTAIMEAAPEFIMQLVRTIPDFTNAIIREVPQIITAFIRALPRFITEFAKGMINAVYYAGMALLDALFGWIPGVDFSHEPMETPEWVDEQAGAMEELTESVNGLKESIDATLYDLLTGDANPATVMERLSIAAGEVEKLKMEFASATGAEKIEAGEDLREALTGYLNVAQDAYQRPSTEYKNIFDSVVGELEGIKTGVEGLTPDPSTESSTGITGITGSIEPVDIFGPDFDSFIDSIKPLINLPLAIWDESLNVAEDVADHIFGGQLSTDVSNIADDIYDAAEEAVEDTYKFIGNGLSHLLAGLGGGSSDTGGDILGTLIAPFSGLSLFHDGGIIRAHSGMFLGEKLASDEIPIIAQSGEGVLNRYNGMAAIGGEAGLNRANRTGKMAGGGDSNVSLSFDVTVNTSGDENNARETGKSFGEGVLEVLQSRKGISVIREAYA